MLNQIHFKNKVINFFLFTIILLSLSKTFAQDYSDPVKDGEIIVERMKDNTLPYRERRNRFGVIFSVNYEQFNPKTYNSAIQNKTFKTLLDDKSIGLPGIELGVKYNYQFGSVAAILGYAQGKIDNAASGVDKISTSITKAGLNFAFDALFSEPYIVPYVQFGIHNINYLERSTLANKTTEETVNKEYSFHYKAGLSFQLNWIEKSIDPSSQEDSLRSSGLENTFIDVFYTSYPEQKETINFNGSMVDADLSSGEIGVGLKLEF